MRQVKIRKYKKDDAVQCTDLIYKVFKKFNGSDFFNKDGIHSVLHSLDTSQLSLKEIMNIFERTSINYVATKNNEIIGVIRGNSNHVHSFAVDGKYHKQGIGRKLITKFERQAQKQNSEFIKLKASLFAVKFYETCGYKKTTGLRNFRGLKIINMKKRLIS